MNLLDVTGNGKHLVNLDLVRYIRREDVRGRIEIKFVYGNGDESIFHVTQGRFAVIDDILYDYKVAVA